MVGIFLASVPGAYFNAVLVCFFVNLFRLHGLVFNPTKALKLVLPAFKTMLSGFVPAVILTTAIQMSTPSMTYGPLLLVPLGILVSAVLLHRMLLAEISNTRNWNVAIAILALVQAGFVGFVLYQIQISL
jgi:hypothetical protein